MRTFLAVAQGTQEPAYFIILEHAPPGTEQDAPLVFWGKGSPSIPEDFSQAKRQMDMMKHDMAGAAAVLGPLKSLEGRRFRDTWWYSPLHENMPGGRRTSRGRHPHPLQTDG